VLRYKAGLLLSIGQCFVILSHSLPCSGPAVRSGSSMQKQNCQGASLRSALYDFHVNQTVQGRQMLVLFKERNAFHNPAIPGTLRI